MRRVGLCGRLVRRKHVLCLYAVGAVNMSIHGLGILIAALRRALTTSSPRCCVQESEMVVKRSERCTDRIRKKVWPGVLVPTKSGGDAEPHLLHHILMGPLISRQKQCPSSFQSAMSGYRSPRRRGGPASSMAKMPRLQWQLTGHEATVWASCRSQESLSLLGHLKLEEI